MNSALPAEEGSTVRYILPVREHLCSRMMTAAFWLPNFKGKHTRRGGDEGTPKVGGSVGEQEWTKLSCQNFYVFRMV